MGKSKKFFFTVIFIFILSLSSISCAADHYATTDMTWAEFYAGETGQTSSELERLGLDAITSATSHAISRFPLLLSTSNDAGSTITGVKAVQVKMTDEVYNALEKIRVGRSDTGLSRFTFVDETFTEYKEVTSLDTFGAMVDPSTKTYTTEAKVTLKSGADSTWGSYMLEISGVPIDIGTGQTMVTGRNGSQTPDSIARYFLGGTIKTSDGTVYGLRHDSNLWSSSKDIAITVDDAYMEIHGTGITRDYEYTASIVGKTITEIKYMLKNSPDVVISGLNLKVEAVPTARAVNPEGGLVAAGGDLNVTISFDNVPSGVTYAIASVQRGGGRGAVTLSADTDYSYSNNIVTLKNAGAGFYRVTFKSSDTTKAPNIRASFYVKDAYYATTDMTWAEFYAGEIGKTATTLEDLGLDAYSSATTYNYRSFPLASADVITSADNKNYTMYYGVKDVQVRISPDVYADLSNKSRYTFINASETAFTEYKPVNADGSFGKMVTETTEVNDATVTVTGGASSTWGSYTLNIRNADVDLGVLATDSGHGTARNLLGATIETSDGTIYGMRPNSNTFSELAIALTVNDEYVEGHGADNRPYEYTKDISGKTIKKITYMLKNLPDVVISCDVKLADWTDATATVKEPQDGFLLTGKDLSFDISFDNLPSGVAYNKLSTVYIGSGRTRTVITTSCDYSGSVLTLKTPTTPGDYTVVFATESGYVDIKTTFTLYTTDAADKVISSDKNAAGFDFSTYRGLQFMITPKGALSRTDKALEENNWVNATDYANVNESTSAFYTSGTNEIQNSGFTFDIPLSNVPSGKTAVLGFSMTAPITAATLGSQDLYDKIASTVKTFESVEEGGITYYKIDADGFKELGISVKSNSPERDLTDKASAGAFFVDDVTLCLTYGAMLADSSTETEKVYDLSPEGEMLINDGTADGHIKATWYLATASTTANNNNNEDNGSGTRTEALTEPKSGTSETPSATVTENVNKSEAKTKIVTALENALKELFSNFSFPDGAADTILTNVNKGTAKSYTASQLSKFIGTDENNPITLEPMSVDKAGIYLFKVNRNALSSFTGMKFFIRMIVTSLINGSSVDEVLAAADNNGNSAGVFVDDDGNILETVPATGNINAAAYMSADIEYTPLITTAAANSNASLGGSGGGCSSFFASSILLGLAILIKRRR